MMDAFVTISKVSRSFRNDSRTEVHAVDDVSFTIGRGEFALVIGPNGSGKTTLLSLIGCLIGPSSGTIRINGLSVSDVPREKLAAFRLHHIGFIFQTFRLIESLSAVENVELVLNLAGIRREASRSRAASLMEEFEVGHRATFLPHALSGGEKQRVAISRAFANDPDLILADEPTGSLDSASGENVIDRLAAAARRRGKTVIVVSHDARIRPFADRVFRMEDGRILAEEQP